MLEDAGKAAEGSTFMVVGLQQLSALTRCTDTPGVCVCQHCCCCCCSFCPCRRFCPLNPARYDCGHFFPGTGAVDDVGRGAGAGRTVNVPWDGPGPGDADYIAALTQV